MIWTPEATALLTKLYATDLTTIEIGVRLGCTKNAVIGKMNRIRKENAANLTKAKSYVSLRNE